MSRSTPISVHRLTKSFGAVRAVDDLSFRAEPGLVTGFLGPNGAGKTTTLRMLLGLVTPDDGHATFGGQPYAALERPAGKVGAVLEASGFHPARTGRDHLLVVATVVGVSRGRVGELLELVGLSAAADRRVGGYSLGMRQRLAFAGALLGDPDVLVLDEPANGLDPEGISWMRRFLRQLAAEGRTVLVSSHVLSEMQQLVDRVVIVHRGKLVRQGSLAELAGGDRVVSVRTPEPDRLREVLSRAGIDVVRVGPADAGHLRANGTDPTTVGRLAHAEGIELRWLSTEASHLEEVFLSLTATARPPAPSGQEV